MTDEEFVNTVVGLADPSRDTEIRMSSKDYQSLMRHGFGRLQPTTRADLLKQGHMGELFVDGEHSLTVKVVKDIAPGTVAFSLTNGFSARAFVLYKAEETADVDYPSRFDREFDI